MSPNPAMARIQSDSLAINFEFDVRPREVKPSFRCFFVFGQLTLRKISKIGVARCQILRLKCTKFGSAEAPPQTPLGELIALPRPPNCI